MQISQVFIIHLRFLLEARELLLSVRHFDNDRGRLASGWVHRGAKDVSSESLTTTSRELKGGMGIIESVDGIPGPQSGDVTGEDDFDYAG